MTKKKPLPKGATCKAPTASGKPCGNTIGLARHGRKIMCAAHAAKAKRDAVKDTGKPKRIRARRATTDQDTRACCETTNKGNPCQIKQGLQLLGGEVLCPTHRRKRKRDSRGVVRNTPLRHEAKCRICQSPHRAELESAYVDGALSATQLAQRLDATKWTVYRHMKYFGLDHERALNALPYMGEIMSRGFKNNPTARDAVAAAGMAFKISGQLDRQITEQMQVVNQQYSGAVVAMLDQLNLDPIVYKRAGEILEREINRRIGATGIVESDDLDTWNLEEDDDEDPESTVQH